MYLLTVVGENGRIHPLIQDFRDRALIESAPWRDISITTSQLVAKIASVGGDEIEIDFYRRISSRTVDMGTHATANFIGNIMYRLFRCGYAVKTEKREHPEARGFEF